MEYAVITSQLEKRYGKTACVKDLDLKIPKGAVYGFLGPNGAGKSTTLKMILGLARPTAGSVSVFGQAMNAKNRLSILRQVGSLIESPSYYGHLTGEENVQIIQALCGAPGESVDEVLRIVRLEGQKRKKVSQYSLGMKQRLGIACSLVGDPRLLILDEPTNGLDPAGIQEIRELIISLPANRDMTVIVSSHLLGEIDQIATEVGIIRSGELVFQDSMQALHAQSREHLAIRTTDNALAARLLGQKGVPCKTEADFLALPRLSDKEAAACVRYLVESGAGVTRLEERRKSLEDIFLELTGTEASL